LLFDNFSPILIVSTAEWSAQDKQIKQEGLKKMIPRPRLNDVETTAPAAEMARAILTGAATVTAHPANDVTRGGRPGLLVRRRRRLSRREAH
jgi:hypothetical protein